MKPLIVSYIPDSDFSLQILFVLVAAGGSPAWAQSSLFGFSNNFQQPAPATPSTTPVPILRYVDNQNIDGSYTYGYEVMCDHVGLEASSSLFIQTHHVCQSVMISISVFDTWLLAYNSSIFGHSNWE